MVIEAYEQPIEGYAVDVNIPDESSLSGFRYDNVDPVARSIRCGAKRSDLIVK
ncbi:hypothetical protein XA26_60500 [Mycolicibacterium fortuitum]|uniref:Uncharacterized protein n=1 Tax=Mycolicibacterium fortuitum TaxID=1766 RepID=A0A0N7H9S4_MYCFO|nr:hypothetical protein XA26_60500 [Mycolicibacterium fortuitum]